jgi:acyl transferase domain-containing protein
VLVSPAASPTVVADDRGPVAVFSAQGAQWPGMGRSALATHPAFRDTLAACDRSLGRHGDLSLTRELAAPDPGYRAHHHPSVVQPAMTCLQIALLAVLRDAGVDPVAVAGLSMGEAAAAHAAGALGIDEAVDVARATAGLAEATLDTGSMIRIALGWEAAGRLVADLPRVERAVEMTPGLTVLAGGVGDLETVLARARERGVDGGPLPLTHAYHSGRIDPLQTQYAAQLARHAPRPARLPFYSSVTTGRVAAPGGAAYWWGVCRRPSRFWTVARHLLADGYRRFVEIGPRPVLAGVLAAAGAELGVTVSTAHLMDRDDRPGDLEARVAELARVQRFEVPA